MRARVLCGLAQTEPNGKRSLTLAPNEKGEQTVNHEPIARIDIVRRLSLLLALGLVAQWCGEWFGFWTR
jgi:hypothetical protein